MDLAALWLELDKAIAAAKLGCGSAADGCDARCCKFKESNLEPYLARSEFDAIRTYLTTCGIPLPPHSRDRCRFLDSDDTCMVYDARPTQCRVFFCGGDTVMKELPDEILNLGTAYDKEHPDDKVAARPMSGIIDEIWNAEDPSLFF